ncbi:hypothetical protein FGG19_gp07 [Mycobacterium phage HelDan]|uniref:Uncharacterized protein n=1 Tax=Mycobacterium phage HelDan TaxID=2922217 RepID=G1DAD9_9CAUD|nr:hypothetical protein FGG19_gp07 [Mycobacterium phage HelDan]AEJ92027.1 hypothetical protein HELDAN_90 [Mycobacterium phage HelDan]
MLVHDSSLCAMSSLGVKKSGSEGHRTLGCIPRVRSVMVYPAALPGADVPFAASHPVLFGPSDRGDGSQSIAPRGQISSQVHLCLAVWVCRRLEPLPLARVVRCSGSCIPVMLTRFLQPRLCEVVVTTLADRLCDVKSFDLGSSGRSAVVVCLRL